jgi:hypothetical protein
MTGVYTNFQHRCECRECGVASHLDVVGVGLVQDRCSYHEPEPLGIRAAFHVVEPQSHQSGKAKVDSRRVHMCAHMPHENNLTEKAPN